MFRVLRLSASIEENPWQDIRQKEAATESRRNLTPDELKKVCSKATGSLRYLIALGLYSGMRLGDCACLAWSAVNFENGIIAHVPMKTSRKGRTVRIPIHPVLDSLLRELREDSSGKYLFPEERKSYLHDASLLSRKFKRFLKKTCEIETQDANVTGQRKNTVCRVGFHSLRHSFVSLCAANRVPQVAIMELVGHGSPAMTALYSHAGDEQKTKAITALPSVSFENEVEE
jgi:integrase